MGQTLTHGVYLPDEGERNCYSGLAGNWNILDGAVGTIAEHTTALAGKAPAVHTHAVSDITDFPAYGNTAGTICEGNDSRLSDARTPVAHTHTKSDVTNLFNSANTWRANNEYTYLIGLSGAEIWFKQQNIEDITANPDANISKSIIQIYNKTVTQYSGGIADNLRTDGSHRLIISCFGFPLNNYAGYYPHAFYFEAKRDGTASFSPSYTNASLGTSTNKWKTFNGTNPGALSLPDYTLAKMDLIDFSQWSVSGQRNEYTPVSDGWLFVNIKDTASNSIFIYAHSLYNTDPAKATDYSASCFGNGSQGMAGRIAVMLPVRAGIVYGIIIKAASVSEIFSAKFYPALGNV